MNLFNSIFNINLKKNMGLFNMTDDFFCLFLKSLKIQKKNVLVVVDSLFEANKLYNLMCNYSDDVLLFPMDDFLTSEALAISPDLMIKRLETINSINNNDYGNVVITNMMGYLRFLPTKKDYLNSIIDLHIGDTIEPKGLVKRLVGNGYKVDTIVNKTGEVGLRGYVVDIFPIDFDDPVRIEFFDNEIESIRIFDADSQKSISKIESVSIYPFSEFICDKNVPEEHFCKQKYLSLYCEVSNIGDYLNDTITIFRDYSQLETSFSSIMNDVMTYRSEKDTNFSTDYMFNFYSLIPKFPIYYYSLDNISDMNVKDVCDFNVKTIYGFNEDSSKINNFINDNIHSNKTVVICVKKYLFKSLYKFLNMKVVETDFSHLSKKCVNLIDSSNNKGFIYNDLVLLTANELFNINNSNKKYTTKYKYSSTINDIDKLNVGDYVVHNIHGIGRYNGITTLSLNDITKDYLEILYQGTDKIYIPVEKIDLISKYSGREGYTPKINKLGGNDWQKTKSRVKSKINDMADQLIKLYAEREASKGFAFSKDNELSFDFEKSFPYDLTIDQKNAIIQIKEDMEKDTPMDRLLCGDVGFGKTEVAFVAAFKAILDSKQVLFLCPTTILSNQHYENALNRFKNFPVNIGLLNRFSSSKDVERIVSGLKDGTMDFVIGTHRLLSDDVIAKDLGLLIIDEEQRFGVAHKEKIKKYKSNIDVLTLTATPIPRTLQMSLVGIRSLSLISTPPTNRYPVQTYVVEENKQIMKDAIYKELSRDGQIYILYNRVQSIDEFANRIRSISPDARISIAHGQMSKNQLETTVMDFINHKYDILICTTIIETGIDIANVNTLIIMDADRFGLSQLYQIRGRVGRSDKFAYAYLMYQPFKSLTENAVKRLNVIKEFTELGSGFSIATRDLSIRGAGDILGSEQAGFIDSVGIDLYLKMLNDEIDRRNNCSNVEDEEEEGKPLISVTTHISDDYVSDDDLKIEIHKKINSVSSLDSFKLIKSELEDRFGRLDEDIIIYMYEEWFENLAKKVKICNVHQNKNSIELVFNEKTLSVIDTETLFMDAFSITPMFRFVSKGSFLVIVLDIIKLDKHPIYYLVDLLSKISVYFEKSID